MLTCKICNKNKLKSLISHITRVHKISVSDYKKIYKTNIVHLQPPLSIDSIQKIKKTLEQLWSNENFKKKQRKYSNRCVEYWIAKGYDKASAKKILSENAKRDQKKFMNKYSKLERRKFRTRCIEYWINRGYSKIEAEQKISKRARLDSERSRKFFGKHHTIKSKQKISQKMIEVVNHIGVDKFIQRFPSGIRSKGENNLFLYIKENINPNVIANPTILNKIPDMIVSKKIIEFFGDFWHANPIYFKSSDVNKFGIKIRDIWKRDSSRIKYFKSRGYRVLIIWEYDWKNKRELMIEKIRNFLK
jgi:hypothetical protein